MARVPRPETQRAAESARTIASRVKDSGMGRYARRHPIISAAIGMAAVGGIASGRRRSGLDKPSRRPTGMYGY